ncbi:MAG: GNAT family N-acetyltransferase [Pseudomonadota bacterium]
MTVRRDDITIRNQLRPGDLGKMVALHGTAYRDDDGHFGLVFEAFVARTIAEFILDNKGRGKVWLAELEGNLVALSAIVERKRGAETHGQLRWILADPIVRGLGLGKELVAAAIDHARAQGWQAVFLETTDGLDASMSIYEKLGFEVTHTEKQSLWLGENTVITMEMRLR